MKKEIRVADEKRGIVQITIADERWYMRQSEDPETKLPIMKEVPSVTWIAGHYPKGIAFYKWLAEKGWDESQAIKNAAGNKGSKVHLAIEDIIAGKEVRIDSKYKNKESGQLEDLTVEEIECITAFLAWKEEVEGDHILDVVASEVVVFSDKHNYAGTIDLIIRLTNRETKLSSFWLIDLKTGQSIWPEYELQVSAYHETITNGENTFDELPANADLKLAILQIGYRLNKRGYKFTTIEPQFDMFLAAKKIWAKETEGQSPKKKDYPIVLSKGKEEPKASEPEAVAEPEPQKKKAKGV